MSTIRTIRHQRGEYPVIVRSAEEIGADLADSWVITDENVAQAWSSILPSRRTLVLPAGEQTKSLEYYGKALEWLAGHGARRNSKICLWGGGVLGDLGGFVAATYSRGIHFVQIPTTLLAMVDSSVGGKVGIDLPQGKNLVGVFAPPKEVWIAPEWLGTLPRRELINGMAEVWKYGYIRDLELLEDLRSGPLSPGDPRLVRIIARCINTKADIVESDEFETSGERSILNFGHTVGHAIEKVLGYTKLLHGEAIAIGMVIEARIGEALGITPEGTSEKIRRDMHGQELPSELPSDLSESALIESMRLDKKATGPALAFSLLHGFGECKLYQDVPESVAREVLRSSCKV